MSQSVNAHPSRDKLILFGQGKLPSDELTEISEHISHCHECCQTLQQPTADTLENLVRRASESTAETPEAIPPQLKEHPRYEVQSLLGVGGMGMVYRAKHQIMGRDVALKVMSPRLLTNPDAIERFRREVRAAAQLNHPNIVTAHDADEAQGLHFLVMEYVDGLSLDKYVARKGPLPVTLACHVIRQAALGLSHAHQQRMIHRDIKPQNIMITRKGQIKVLDFGLARLAREIESKSVSDSQAFQTTASMTIGTPDYLSPEQARNLPDLDQRSDLYSLGCTFYFLLTGQVPFAKATTVIDKLLAHTKDVALPIRAFRNDVPAEVERIIQRLMVKKPEERYSTAAELISDLTPFLKNNEATIPLPELPKSSPKEESVSPIVDDPEIVTESDIVTEAPRKKRRKKKVPSKPKLWLIASCAGILSLLLVTIIYFATRPGGNREVPKTATQTMASKGAVASPVVTNLNTKKVLFILPSYGLWNDDYLPVRKRLEEAGIVVKTASSAKTANLHRDPRNVGSEVIVDIVLPNSDALGFDAIIFSGFNVMPYITDARTRTLIDSYQSGGKVVAAICGGQQVLARLGYLNGKQAAFSELGSKGNMNGSIQWQQQPVVTDGQFVTASSGDDALPFANALIRALSAK